MTRIKAKTNPVQSILDRIKLQRLKKGFTQEYMAVQLDCNYTSYGKIESGKTALTVEKLFEIAEVLQIPVSQLLDNHSSDSETKTNGKARLIVEVELSEEEIGRLGGWERFIKSASDK